MTKDENLKCRQKLRESFNAFAMSDIESSEEGNGRRTIEWRWELVIEWLQWSMKHWKKEGVVESHPQEQKFWNVPILLKLGMVLDFWLLQVLKQILTNFLCTCFAFTLEVHLEPMPSFQKTKISYPFLRIRTRVVRNIFFFNLSESFTNFLNRWSRIDNSFCSFDKTKKIIYIYIYIYIYILIPTYMY